MQKSHESLVHTDMSMKRALISDIHGNLEALTAVLNDISEQAVDEVYCLGDIVGYGPNPSECLMRVMEMKVCIPGNHEDAVLSQPGDLSPGVLRWTFTMIEGWPPCLKELIGADRPCQNSQRPPGTVVISLSMGSIAHDIPQAIHRSQPETFLIGQRDPKPALQLRGDSELSQRIPGGGVRD